MVEKNYNSCLSKLDKILIAHIYELFLSYQKSKKSTASNFLNPREFKIVSSYLKKRQIPFSVYEPYDFLEKKVIYFGNYQNFVTIYQGKSNDFISHPQILKTLFSFGFSEEMIGDILVEKNSFYLTNLSRLNSFLESNLVMIYHHPVTLQKVEEIHLTEEHFESKKILVSSMRLDNVVSKICGKSRNQIKTMILEQKIFFNYEVVKNTNVSVQEGDILSIQKIGKFRIGKIEGVTKKQNLILIIEKYK